MQNRSRHKQAWLLTIVYRFREEKMIQTSAALAFTTLLALIPLATLVVAVSSALPFVDIFIRRLDVLLVQSLLPSGSAGVIAGYISKFAAKAQALTVPGIGMLVITAFLLLHTVEETFNRLWLVKPRPYWQRIRLYAFVMVIWPFLMGGIAVVISYAVTTSLGFFDEPNWMRQLALKGLSLALLGLFFGFLYYAVPNAPVSKRSAITGGMMAALAFSLMQQGFEFYLAHVGTFNSVYGAFAAVPIFLVWLHFSWALILLGGLIVATVFRPSRR